jgi:hypothetical protein
MTVAWTDLNVVDSSVTLMPFQIFVTIFEGGNEENCDER